MSVLVKNKPPTSPSFDEEQPIYHDIDDNTPPIPIDLQPPSARPKLRSPIPQLKTSASMDNIESLTYDDPNPDNYHVLQNNGSLESSMEQPHYDDVGVDDRVVYTMNKNPPPVWRPEVDNLRKPPLPPNRRAVSSEPEDFNRRGQPMSKSPLSSPARRGPMPPPKPKQDQVVSPKLVGGFGGLLGIKDDPKFKRKLQEKREEIYGGGNAPIHHTRSMSMGEGEEFYESVLYTADDAGAYEKEEFEGPPPRLLPKTDSMRKEVGLLERSPPPPPLPSREVMATSSSTGDMTRRNGPTRANKHPSPRHPAQVSPRHHSDGSTPNTPPPLPSRELVNPSLPPFSLPASFASCQELEAPPPVPSRNHSSETLRSGQPLSPSKWNTLPMSPSHRVPTAFQLPNDHRSSDQQPFSRQLAQILTKSPGKQSPKSPPLARQGEIDSQEGYEDVQPPDENLEETYDDIAPVSAGNNSRISQRHTLTESYDDIFPISAHSQCRGENLVESYDDILPVRAPQPVKKAPLTTRNHSKSFTETLTASYDDILPPQVQQPATTASRAQPVPQDAPPLPPRHQPEALLPSRHQHEPPRHQHEPPRHQHEPPRHQHEPPRHQPEAHKPHRRAGLPQVPPDNPPVPPHRGAEGAERFEQPPALPPNKPRPEPPGGSPSHKPATRTTPPIKPRGYPTSPPQADPTRSTPSHRPVNPPVKPRGEPGPHTKPARTNPAITPRTDRGVNAPSNRPRPAARPKPSPLPKKPPVMANKPTPASKPHLQPAVARKPAPPTHPKPKLLATVESKPKPLVPKKPIIPPLSS